MGKTTTEINGIFGPLAALLIKRPRVEYVMSVSCPPKKEETLEGQLTEPLSCNCYLLTRPVLVLVHADALGSEAIGPLSTRSGLLRPLEPRFSLRVQHSTAHHIAIDCPRDAML